MKKELQPIKENPTMTGTIIAELRDAVTGKLKKRFVYPNLVCNTGKNAVASILNNEVTYTGAVTHMAVGTGTNVPNVSDTQLQAELSRVAPSTQSRVTNVTTINFFYNSTVANGTIREIGAFIDGTATVNSGALFDRVNANIVKTAADTLTVNLIITVN